MSRNPKVDPRPGDVLRIRGGTYYHVAMTPRGRVIYNTRVGKQWLNSGRVATLAEWRQMMADAEVFNAEGEGDE